jgi:hypothetical protein
MEMTTMSIIEHARNELIRIDFGMEDSKVMLHLLAKFLKQWDSGGAVAVAAPVLVRLLKGQPLAPLTGADDEWSDPMGDGIMLQNKRCSSVLKSWRGPDGLLSEVAGLGEIKFNDIDNPEWDGTFPYDPATRIPTMPILEIETA